ncbi:LysR family transcriptional regulator [Paenibacillus sp. 1011MAR3C5]|uniref:LysR family transcriptional regulator n=1 Tax=Paenibacillus sp. 1011MAR3C5 TaxID=1675787 RepID=UPI000E6BDADA|nr:LysR family transcriptional regulator [Paenibacillus sp. 1011MAR3C5]RJE86209.1 LysR family transcriptional regulator [Paenibacillus sp. 1011MAR3C5]
MDLQHLKYFQTVARLEHMTYAAQQLHMAQPALSVIISRMEEQLGMPLFNREGRRIKLNAYGKIYLEKVNIALHALEEGQREMADLAGIETSTITIAATTLNRFSSVLGPYLAAHPQANFRITQTAAEEMKVQLLHSGEIDFVFAAPPVTSDGIAGVNLLTEEIMLVVPPTHRFASRGSIRLSEAADEPFISLRPGYSFRDLTFSYCAQAGFVPRVVCEGDEPASIGSLVRAGLGVGFLPAAAHKNNSPLTFLKIEEPVCRRTMQLAWLEGRYLSEAARSFRDYVISCFSSDNSKLEVD